MVVTASNACALAAEFKLVYTAKTSIYNRFAAGRRLVLLSCCNLSWTQAFRMLRQTE